MVCVWCSLKATSSLTFRSEIDSEGKEKQASEREIDCGSTGALAFKDVGDFRPRSLVLSCLACQRRVRAVCHSYSFWTFLFLFL